MDHVPGQPDHPLGERITRAYARGPHVPAETDRAILAALNANLPRRQQWGAGGWRTFAAAAAIGLLAGSAAWWALRPAHHPDMVDVLRARQRGATPAELDALTRAAVLITREGRS